MDRGRPTKYNEEICTKAIEYIVNYKEYGDAVPLIDGLALELGVHRDTINEWTRVHEDFSDIVKILKTKQSRTLKNGALNGTLKERSANLFLASQHGWVTRSEQEVVITDERVKHPDIIHLVAEPLPEGITDAQLCD